MIRPIVICADVGTTSLKAGAIGFRGEVVSLSNVPLGYERRDRAALEWLPALQKAVRAVLSEAAGCEAAALCVSGNGPTIVGADGATLLWNESVAALSGARGASLFIPRLLAFRELRRASWESSAFVYSGPEFLAHELTLSSFTILPEARYESAYWDGGALDEAGIPRGKLPPFARAVEPFGALSESAARSLGLPSAIPVFCCGPDFIAAMIGTASLEEGALYDCAGSSEGVNLCSKKKLSAPSIRVLPSARPGFWNAASLIPESGSVFMAAKRAAEKKAGREISSADFARREARRAAREGKGALALIAANFREALAALLSAAKDAGVSARFPVAVTGGQAGSDGWMRMKCDAAGVPLSVCACADAELLGDAAVALAGLGESPSIESASALVGRPSKIFEPRSRAF